MKIKALLLVTLICTLTIIYTFASDLIEDVKDKREVSKMCYIENFDLGQRKKLIRIEVSDKFYLNKGMCDGILYYHDGTYKDISISYHSNYFVISEDSRRKRYIYKSDELTNINKK